MITIIAAAVLAVVVMIVLGLITIACIAIIFPGLTTGIAVIVVKLTIGMVLVGWLAERKARS